MINYDLHGQHTYCLNSHPLQDWFQYSPDFSAQTKVKQLPYLYVILTDTILTLHSSTVTTPENPDEEAEQIIGMGARLGRL